MSEAPYPPPGTARSPLDELRDRVAALEAAAVSGADSPPTPEQADRIREMALRGRVAAHLERIAAAIKESRRQSRLDVIDHSRLCCELEAAMDLCDIRRIE